MPLAERRLNIANLSDAELTAALEGPCISDEERERRHPHLAWMRARAAEAIERLQQEGILDPQGNLLHPELLPDDMQPGSKTEC